MNRYLEKIAELHNREAEAAKMAGKGILADKIGDGIGMVLGGYLGHRLGKGKALGALVGSSITGSALSYASIRRDYLNSHKDKK